MNSEAETVQLDDEELALLEAAFEAGDRPEEDELDPTSHVVK